MNNQKEAWHREKRLISKGRVVVGIAMTVAVLGAGIAIVTFKNARDFLEQSGAIAIGSFRDVFVPMASGTIVSMIPIASSDMSSGFGEAASIDLRAATVGNGGSPDVPRDTAKNEITAGSGAVLGDRADDWTDAAVITNISARQTTSSGSSSVIKGLSTGIAASDTNVMDNAGNFAGVTGGELSEDCSFPVSAPVAVSHRVVLNEIAWMGLPSSTGETADRAAGGEWIELKNVSDTKISLDGWRVMNPEGTIKISFGASDVIAPGGFYLLSRGGNPVNDMSPDKAYAGILSNDGGKLAVFDASCGISDFLDASLKWPGGSNETKQTLERRADLTWQTSAAAGGTPRAENSSGTTEAPAVSGTTKKYKVNVMIVGDGGGKVTMEPGGTVCKISCTNEYAEGIKTTLTASAGSNAVFAGWSGGCSGTSGCSFVVNGSVAVMADFRLNIDGSPVTNVGSASPFSGGDIDLPGDTGPSLSDSTSTANSSSSSSDGGTGDASTTTSTSSPPIVVVPTGTLPLSSPVINHLVIAALQIMGATADEDFVKIYNPMADSVDISGWKLRKKSSMGTDSSLREFPAGSTVAAGGYFTWASSVNGFALSIDADASSTGSLAANNSVALFDGNGAQVDAVAWGTGTNQYVEGAAYPTSPVANQVLKRKSVDGSIADTDNNNNDFAL